MMPMKSCGRLPKIQVNAQLADQNLVVLYTCPWPGQGFYFKKAVTSSADTQGIKFRSYNTATAQIAKELGMLPVQVEAAELSQALATGVAEAFISSGATGYDRKVWEHLSHYYKVNAWLPRNYVLINKGVWDGLSSGTQANIQRAADETGAACLAKSEGLANWYFEQLEANGMQVIDAGPEFLKELKAIGAKMQSDWLLLLAVMARPLSTPIKRCNHLHQHFACSLYFGSRFSSLF